MAPANRPRPGVSSRFSALARTWLLVGIILPQSLASGPAGVSKARSSKPEARRADKAEPRNSCDAGSCLPSGPAYRHGRRPPAAIDLGLSDAELAEVRDLVLSHRDLWRKRNLGDEQTMGALGLPEAVRSALFYFTLGASVFPEQL